MAELTERPERYAPAESPESHDELRALAVRSLRRKQQFRGHLFVYLVVNVALWAVWAVEVARNGYVFPWPVFPTFFWGLFVLGRARDVYGRSPLREERISGEMERMRRLGPRAWMDGDAKKDSGWPWSW
ncbi:MAG: 2TM domain-containing protein [Gaiellaceae bacterium]